jgi:hypothetical protein
VLILVKRQTTNKQGKAMLKILVKKLVRKIGMVNLLLLIGDTAVKATKSKKDDKVWNEVKAMLETFS